MRYCNEADARAAWEEEAVWAEPTRRAGDTADPIVSVRALCCCRGRHGVKLW
ncbi:MAG: hypothetical protein LBG69_04020 [Zoogloeaceae bacterium]|nr:hypothetical protein [Zoogloeaceae bacterium]